MKHYSLRPAEEIRKRLDLTPEQFSVHLRYSPVAYRYALKVGHLSWRMARVISDRFKIPFAQFTDGG